MFRPRELERVFDLQQRSYRLLLWVNRQLRRGGLDFSHAHEALSAADAAEEWIRRHLASLPADARPEKAADIASFAHLFASYLTTSFELVEKPGYRLASHDNCYCPICSYLVAADRLKTRKVTRGAQESALELKRAFLQALAEDSELALIAEEIEGLLTRQELAPHVALATYAAELLRRSQFASQGKGILALWREIAWEKGSPRPGFELTAKGVLAAEKAIVGAMGAV